MTEPYSLSNIRIILEIHSFLSDDFDIYVKTFPEGSEFNLLKETVEYFLLKQGDCRDRRMAFIFEHPQGCYALLFQTLAFNASLVRGLMSLLQNHQEYNTVEGILSSQYWNNFLFLYGRIEVHALFQSSQTLFIQTILESLPQFYSQASIATSVQLLKDEPSIELTEHLINMLSRGNIYEVKKEVALKKHHVLCAKTFEDYLTRLQHHELGDYLTVMEILRILVKYTLLIQQRQLFTLPVENAHAKKTLDTDKIFKRLIFGMSFKNVSELSLYLSINGITKILSLKHDLDTMMQVLNTQKIMQYQTIIAWEHALEQQAQAYLPSWSTWGKEKTISVVTYCYQRSFMGLGAQLSEWLASLLLPEYFSSIAKKVGLGLGSFYTYSVGLFGSLPMLGLIFIAEQTRAGFTTEYINTEQARVISNESSLPSMSTLMRAGDLFMNAIMAWMSSTPEPLYRTISATGVSVIFTSIADKMLLDLSQDMSITEKDKAYIRFLVTTLGMQCGNTLFNFYTHLARKIKARTEACEAINLEMQTATCSHQITFPNLFLSPTLWFSADNPMTLSWSSPKSSHEASCNIVSDNSRSGVVECTVSRPPQSLIVGKV